MKSIAFVTSPEPAFNEKKVALNISQMVRRRYDVDIITGVSEWNIKSKKNVSVSKYRKTKNSFFGIGWTLRSLYKHTQSNEIDVVINVSKVSTIGLGVSIFGILNDVKTATRFTGDANHDPLMYDKLRKMARKFVLHNIIPFLVAIFSDHCIVLGPNFGSVLEIIKSKENIFCIPQPVKQNRFQNISDQKLSNLRSQLEIGCSDKLVLYVGRISWHKGADIIHKIAQNVYDRDSSVKFCLVGEVKEKEMLKYLDVPNIKHVGTVSNKNINIYYAAADIFILPSRSEGLPNVVLEALSAEMSIMASPVGEINHYVKNTSIRVEDYVNFILKSENTVDRLPERLEWSNLENRYLSFLNKIA